MTQKDGSPEASEGPYWSEELLAVLVVGLGDETQARETLEGIIQQALPIGQGATGHLRRGLGVTSASPGQLLQQNRRHRRHLGAAGGLLVCVLVLSSRPLWWSKKASLGSIPGLPSFLFDFIVHLSAGNRTVRGSIPGCSNYQPPSGVIRSRFPATRWLGGH